MDDSSFECSVAFETKCIRCRATREVLGEEPEAELIVRDSDCSDDDVLTSGVVRVKEPCECGEHRVRVRVTLGQD